MVMEVGTEDEGDDGESIPPTPNEDEKGEKVDEGGK